MGGSARIIGECTVRVKDLAPKGMRLLDLGCIEEAVEINVEVVGGLASYWSHGVKLVLDEVRSWKSTTRASTLRIGESSFISGIVRVCPYITDHGWPTVLSSISTRGVQFS